MNIGASQVSPGNSYELPGIATKEEQRKAFGKAKRHTYAVKLLKWALPLASLGIIGLYLIPNGTTSIVPDLPISIDSLGLSSKGLKMINPRYAGGNDKIGHYKIEAEYALQQISSTHVLELHKISGLIEQPNKKWTKLTANKGIYDTKTELMQLEGNILISSNQGMEAHMQSARINMKKQIIITDEPVQMKMNGNVINAASMNLDIAKKHVVFGGGVKVKLLKNKAITN